MQNKSSWLNTWLHANGPYNLLDAEQTGLLRSPVIFKSIFFFKENADIFKQISLKISLWVFHYPTGEGAIRLNVYVLNHFEGNMKYAAEAPGKLGRNWIITSSYCFGAWRLCDKTSYAIFKSLVLGVAIWYHGSWSPLAQVMACYLMVTCHYLNQHWLMINRVQCYFTRR